MIQRLWGMLACAVLIVLLWSPGGQPPVAQAQSATSFRIDFVTGTDGTENTLVVELFGPGAPDPFWRVSVAEAPGDLMPGQTNSYEFPFPGTFCDVVKVHVIKPASIPAGDDAWDIREFFVYVDGAQVAFDRVAYETFSPFTAMHWPINVNWQGTEAYTSRCSGGAALPELAGEMILVGPGLFSVISTPSFLLTLPDLHVLPQPLPDLPPAQALPTLPPDANQITCPGFLPSRLRVGAGGRVLPGVANNLRSAPSVNSQVLGQIPGGGVFSVVEGPSCDAAGIAWWRVMYQNLNGWTSEGQGSVYWVEPVP